MQQQQQLLLSKLHVFEPPSSSGTVPLWAVEGGASLIRTRGTCSPTPALALLNGDGVTSMTCSGRLCCVTHVSGDDAHADGGGQCWHVTLDTSSVCSVVYREPPTPLATLLPSSSPLSSSLCTDGTLIFALSTSPSPYLTVLTPLPHPQQPLTFLCLCPPSISRATFPPASHAWRISPPPTGASASPASNPLLINDVSSPTQGAKDCFRSPFSAQHC